MKVSIDESKCVGCGICERVCPQGIKIENGKAKVIDENAPCLIEAADACPRGAITIEGHETPSSPTPTFGRGMGLGRGFGRGLGRGMGRGPGRGRGRF